MNEEDNIIKEKIIKREKKDIALAYMLVVILLACILIMLYLKFVRNENVVEPTEYTANYIGLDNIVSDINSTLSSKYSGINAVNSDNTITVTYDTITYTIPLINNELEFTINSDNTELSKDLYEEIITDVCTYYRKDREGCTNIAKKVSYNNKIDGVRYLNENVLFINITNSVNPSQNNTVVYKEETITDIDNVSYELNINNITISNIKVDMLATSATISGNISSSSKVIVSLYDNDSKLLATKDVTGDNNFSITFDYDDNLNIESIKKYSINIE